LVESILLNHVDFLTIENNHNYPIDTSGIPKKNRSVENKKPLKKRMFLRGFYLDFILFCWEWLYFEIVGIFFSCQKKSIKYDVESTLE
jgi:hypothetical protein